MSPTSHPGAGRFADSTQLPLIDVAPLLDPSAEPEFVERTAGEIDSACRSLGFFRITGHGIGPDRFAAIDAAARDFFAQPDHVKAEIAMPLAGPAWRGWFPVRGEITSGQPDRKEGLYVGVEHPDDHPRVATGTPLHGANLFPPGPLGPLVRQWVGDMTALATAIMEGIAVGLGLPRQWFAEHLTADPTALFRVFHYPALLDNAESDEWGVGEHTDYGLLTLLAQDGAGGLQVRTPAGAWLDVPADPSVIVCNIGDMLDKLTEGRYRSTPHRVRNVSGQSRLSFPFFFDPSWDAVVTPLPLDDAPPADNADRRWDGLSVRAWTGTYGNYLTAKVSKVFPDLFTDVTG